MIPFFPKVIANKGLTLYFISLAVVSVAFMSHAIGAVWMILGAIEVSLFFLLSSSLSQQWQNAPSRFFVQRVFWISFLLRVAWVVFSYYFYTYQTGVPFEFDAADSRGYHGDAEWLAKSSWGSVWEYLFLGRGGYSDSGYVLYLTVLYKLVGPNILVARFLKAFYGALTAIFVYNIARRSIDERTGRIAGVFAMLMPNLIIYSGLHLKEAEMVFLMVAFLDRADYVLRTEKFKVLDVVLPILIGGSLFLFRTVLGVVAFFSFITALVFVKSKPSTKRRKFVIIAWVGLAVLYFAGGTVINEVETLWVDKDTNQDLKRETQTLQGNQWAKYATGSVMAPMMFVMPFATFVDFDQQNQLVMHGGNYVRNFMGVFVLVALYSMLFTKKNWRNFVLVGSFAIGYLGVVALSGFSNSERFLLPGLPCLIIFWAYGIAVLNAKNYRWVKYWYVIVPIMEIGWAFFKVGSRGLL